MSVFHVTISLIGKTLPIGEMESDVQLDEFNAAAVESLWPTLLACCDVPAWAQAVVDGRPYAQARDLEQRADKAAREFTAGDVDHALAAHPRIGEQAQGKSTEANWSRGEQSAVSQDERTRSALVEGNRAYEQRFNRVFLICASGLSAAQILASLRQRLTHDDATESAVVADELRKIALLRLRKVVSS